MSSLAFWLDVLVWPIWGLIGTIAGVAWSLGLLPSLPLFSIALPPLRILPEKASWSDFWSCVYFDVFTDEIENSTMNSAISSVIMSE